MKGIVTQPDAPTGIPKFGSKKDVATMLGCCLRTVSNLMRRGMPHLKCGPRKTLYDLGEVAAWMKRTYGQQRLGSEGGQ